MKSSRFTRGISILSCFGFHLKHATRKHENNLHYIFSSLFPIRSFLPFRSPPLFSLEQHGMRDTLISKIEVSKSVCVPSTYSPFFFSFCLLLLFLHKTNWHLDERVDEQQMKWRDKDKGKK